jgi:hypothetical protein
MKATSIRFLIEDRGNHVFLAKQGEAAHVVTAGFRVTDRQLVVSTPCPCCQSPTLGKTVSEAIHSARSEGFLPEGMDVYWHHWGPSDQQYLPDNPAFVAERCNHSLENKIADDGKICDELREALTQLEAGTEAAHLHVQYEEKVRSAKEKIRQLLEREKFADALAFAQLVGLEIPKEFVDDYA